MGTFLIAEAGVNHNGSEEKALELVDVAADCGADAIKFQSFSADKLIRRGAPKVEYQRRATGDGDQHEMLKALEMSEALHERLFVRCAERGIEFMSTAFDEESFDFLVKLGIRRVKVPSGELTNLPFLRHMARAGLPLIVSTGMADLQEVVDAVGAIASARQETGASGDLGDDVTILHCTSNYPTRPEDVNLRAMQSIAARTGLPVSYSDHTVGIAISIAAVAMGAVAIEKHFTLDRTLPGPDHAASLEPGELAAMVRCIRETELAMGDGIKRPTESELSVRALVRRSVTMLRDVPAGTILQPSDVGLLRPGTGIPPSDLDGVYGRAVSRDLRAGETVAWPDIA